MKKYFITGTDTDAGKTVAAKAVLDRLAVQQLQTIAMKPVASDCVATEAGLRNADAETLRAAMTLSADYQLTNPYAFAEPIAPHIAAANSRQVIKKSVLLQAYQQLLARQPDAIVVEGAGGWLLPLSDALMMPDVVSAMQAEVILVIGLKLGCLNHALLSAQAIQHQGLRLKGWISVNTDARSMPYQAANIETLRQHIDAPPLGHIDYCADWQQQNLAKYLQPL